MKRVLLTGATGFIGRACLTPLRVRGYEVHAVHRARLPIDQPDVIWHECDLLAPTAAARLVAEVAPTHLLHLAWYATPGKIWTAPENLAWVRASLALHEAFVAAGGRRMVVGGTCAEYDWRHDTCREAETPLAPRSFYGTCKQALGLLTLADAERAGVSASWARYFFLYGPHEYPERLVASVILALLRGEIARCTQGTQQRDYLHVADAAAATVALLDSDVRGPVNVASGTVIAVRALVERLAAMLGTPGRVTFGAVPSDPDDPPVLAADVRRLRDEVGWAPGRDLNEGLRETVEWWRDRVLSGSPR